MPDTGAERVCFQRRRLNAQPLAGFFCLDAVCWRGAGERAVRLFLGAGVRPETLPAERRPPDTLRPTSGRGVARALVLRGLDMGEEGAPVRLALENGVAEIMPSAPEHGLFAGLDVGLAVRNGEPPETVLEWIAWHVAQHGMTGALIVNRVWPGEDAAAFAAALAAGAAGIAGLRRLLVFEADIPLGLDAPPENHPVSAPDAPGKDRMEVPANDPWRAPLGEPVIYEIAKWRFLAEAGAVMNLDPCEVILPRAEGEPSVFDRARAAPSGVQALHGIRAFPWRLREGERPRFGDHICRQFDTQDLHRRWCAAPERAGLDNVWRLARVQNATPDTAAATPFLRCMAIRLTGRATAEIVPKTALVEDAALLELARSTGHKPVRQPRSATRPSGTPAVEAGPTAIVTTMKNEGPFILEWLAYHRAIGVERFLVYTNDCTDGTDTLLDLLQARGIVEHRNNPFREMGLKPQHAALQAAEEEPAIREAGWAICMDVDEFINIHVGDGSLRALYQAVGDANLISLTWRLFGSADIHAFDPEFVTAQFTRCAPRIVRKPHQAWGFKTLFRNLQIYKKLGVHRPKGLKPDLWEQIRWVNGSGRPMPKEMLRNGWRSSLSTYGYDLATLNHYAVRSAESFLVKRDRGRVNHVDRDQGLNYWFRMNFNEEEDRSIQRMLPAAEAEFWRLLADPAIAAQHAACVTAHRARIAELMARPDQAAFYQQLTSPRMEQLCRRHRHFGANVFHAGPDCIPDEALRGDLPESYFFTVPRSAIIGDGH